MPRREILEFVINAYSPETFPMARLAEYMAELAALLGEQGEVHFLRLEGGSSKMVQSVESEALPKVKQRIAAARAGDAPRE